MADTFDIYKICPRCRGDGTVPSDQATDDDEGSYEPTLVTCPLCAGDGELPWGRMEKKA